MKVLKKVALFLLLILLAIQFIKPAKNRAETPEDSGFLLETNPSDEVVEILKNSCYNCHSNQTNYPWYSDISPISFWIDNHIDQGKEHLNFSDWTNYDTDKKVYKLEEIIETIEAGEMPLREYIWLHQDSRLNTQQQKAVIEWAARTKLLYQLDQRPE